MAVPNVNTFEHDIAEEIKTREATLADIAAAGGEVSNAPLPPKVTSHLLLIIGGLLVFLVIAVLGMYIYTELTRPPVEQQITDVLPDPSSRLLAISPIIYDAVGGDIGTTTKSSYGYTMELLSYTNVFSYMLKNEQIYSEELSIAVGSARNVEEKFIPFTFSDVTINNQNMRVGVSGTSTLVYAFVNARTLVISSSTEGILSLRSSILGR